MKYQNAAVILPEEILSGLQAYFQGGLLYIPRAEEKKEWGGANGTRQYYAERNRLIREAHRQKVSIKELAVRFGLAENTVRNIIYRQREGSPPEERPREDRGKAAVRR